MKKREKALWFILGAILIYTIATNSRIVARDDGHIVSIGVLYNVSE